MYSASAGELIASWWKQFQARQRLFKRHRKLLQVRGDQLQVYEDCRKRGEINCMLAEAATGAAEIIHKF
jgi:hypothetical protein